jgi:hypothetical protein
MDDRRKHPRLEIDEPAYVSVGGLSMRCRLLNMSREGAAIEVPDPTFVPSHFRLMIEKDRAVWICRVIWIKQNQIGVAFEETGSEASSGAPASKR